MLIQIVRKQNIYSFSLSNVFKSKEKKIETATKTAT